MLADFLEATSKAFNNELSEKSLDVVHFTLRHFERPEQLKQEYLQAEAVKRATTKVRTTSNSDQRIPTYPLSWSVDKTARSKAFKTFGARVEPYTHHPTFVHWVKHHPISVYKEQTPFSADEDINSRVYRSRTRSLSMSSCKDPVGINNNVGMNES